MNVSIPEAFDLAVQHHQAGRLAEAERLYRQIVAAEPRHADAMHLLGVIGHQVGQSDLAVELILQAIAIAPTAPLFHSNLGQVYAKLGRLDEAVASYRRALQLDPDYAKAHYHLGIALTGLRQFDEAVTAFRTALRLQPDNPDTLNNLGCALTGLGQYDEAVTVYHSALQLRADYADVYNNLGIALREQGHLDEAIAAYRRAIELPPARAEAHSYLIFTLHFHPSLEQEAIAEEQRRWNRQFSDPLAASILPHTHNRDPQRRLRIGYVSPDFREHPVAFFLAPLLEAHDHQRFEIYGYSSVSRPDAVTARLRQCTDVWRDVCYLSDAQLAESIRQDGIDILVDLTLHTGSNRLLAFARKPAPVQVSWLGIPGSTGLETIDYWLTDRFLDPPDEESTSRPGRPFRLPDAWCCCPTPVDSPEVNALPALKIGVVTFASFNNFAKINESVLALWARVLNAVPGSRLRLLTQAGTHQERARAFLQKCGVAPQRCEFLDYKTAAPEGSTGISLRRYLEVDIALDPFPYNGMTTTCHALWMGVPVITRVGKNPVSRAGLSLLHTLGLPELVAQSEEEYVRIAVELAGDLARLAQLRATLRARMAASPLMDAPRFARNMEAAYRTMWQRWCQEKPA